MKLEGEFTFQGNREEVWKLLQDPEILASSMPGTQKLEKIAEDEYESEMLVRVGPVNGIFTSKIVLKDKTPPQNYTMVVDSRGNAGFAKGTALVTLTEPEPGVTLMKYEAELNVGGRLASVGQRLLDTVGKSMTRQSLEAMNQALQARIKPTGEVGEAAETYTPPTQAEFAKAVAKDVIRESPATRRILWIAAAVFAAIVIWIVFL